MTKSVFFVTGIDTGVGKTIATGVLAKRWAEEGKSVVTQKFIQTGCLRVSEDIEVHRRIMGLELLPEDLDGTTCAVVLPYPGSPHMAAQMAGVDIEVKNICQSTAALLSQYDIVLLEGAGGINVPVTDNYTTMDYVVDNSLPVILVTSSRLGSINHTTLTLEALKNRGVEVWALIYNTYPPQEEAITASTRRYLAEYLSKHHPEAEFMEMGEVRRR